MNRITGRMRLTVAAAVAGASMFLMAVPAAHAGLLVQSAGNCKTPPAETPFARWSDSNSYVLMPSGSFESGATGWSLSKASVQTGNESYHVRAGGAADSHSLKISAGGSALSPVECVGIDRPTLRFFVRSSGGLLSLSTMAVSVRFETSLGLVAELPIGVVSPNTSWQPSAPLPIIANLLPLLPNDMTPVQFRFAPAGGASWSIDDVYVDPHARG